MILPDVDYVAPVVHEQWRQRQLAEGVSSRLAPWGEELMVGWDALSERAREWDRDMVRVVYFCIETMSGPRP